MHAPPLASDGSSVEAANLQATYVVALRALRLRGDDPNLFIKSLNLKTAVNELLGDEQAQLRTRGGAPNEYTTTQESAFVAAVVEVYGTHLVTNSKHLKNTSHLVGFALPMVKTPSTLVAPLPPLKVKRSPLQPLRLPPSSPMPMTSRPRVPPASAPPIKRTRDAEHPRWEELWHKMDLVALIDLKKTKVELATSKATVQDLKSIISQQTSTITELVETMKRARSKGAAALMDLADFAEKRSPALVASIARAVASRLGTEVPGAARP